MPRAGIVRCALGVALLTSPALTVLTVRKGTDLDEKGGRPWQVSKERSGRPHGGSAWKLYHPKNLRVATLDIDGRVLRWG
ncbi:hypothetical protein [Arsenicicoccus dermatophilus]|uniref:hypothetical protein n=1 Tax=Arsenicicoccus dermatophilus TaxID=1076331 RepID=UPI001F4CCD59|nr:hypothetical protein [Arsenicicoccus dermatophilus]MCH8613724.1 hypothetical protein [Arsenicicoccus dermatophilus]